MIGNLQYWTCTIPIVCALEYMERVAAECCPYVSRLIYGILALQANFTITLPPHSLH